MEKDYHNLAASQQNACAGAYVGATTAAPPTDDPASLRGQFRALAQVCERLSAQRNCLRDIADTVLGPEPENPATGAANGRIQPVGGVTADIVLMFENAAALLGQVDSQIMRLQRVSA